jgi:hypothetical protein
MSWMSENVRASTSRNLKGLHSLYTDNFFLPFTELYKMLLGLIEYTTLEYCEEQWRALRISLETPVTGLATIIIDT